MRKTVIRKIPECPLCKREKDVGAINSYVASAVRRTYFCTNCMVEFNLAGTLSPPIKEKETSQTAI